MTDLAIASQGFSYAAFESAAMTRLIEETAHAWLRSFGVVSPHAKCRMIGALRDALAEDSFAAPGRMPIQDLLDQAAHDTIALWFEQVTGQADCRGKARFSMMRCAFLSANRDGVCSDRFLDRGGDHHDLARAILAQMMMPTPSPKICAMPRQTLDRRAS